MAVIRKKKKLSSKKIQKGSIGNFFVYGVVGLLMVLGYVAVGGIPSTNPPQTEPTVNIITPTPNPTHNTLQLQTFGYVTPTIAPVKSSLCTAGGINEEPYILTSYYPAQGQTVGQTGQIKVWVTDENPPYIAPGETIDSNGKIVNKGNQLALAPDNYLYEHALYVAPYTAEAGGAAYFPDLFKGVMNNAPQPYYQPNIPPQDIQTGPTVDQITGTAQDPQLRNGQTPQTAEYIWNVSDLKLPAGTYQVEFLIFDGDVNRGIGCVNVTIQ